MIVLFTDFGPSGPYIGQMKAVLAREAPGVPVIDLFADAPAFDPMLSAYLLAAYAPWFAAGTVFLAVVDPGVGTTRPPVAVEADGRWFVGPGNGLFEPVLRRAGAGQGRVMEIAWRPPALSASFHGRDLFAPVAAALATGRAAPLLRAAPEGVSRCPGWPDDLARIVYIDGYGNAMTGLRAAMLPRDARLRLPDGREVRRSHTFGSVPKGEPLWYENSTGLAEVAVNQGAAAKDLKLKTGDPVWVADGGDPGA